jgi:hypothetical protein
MEDVASHWIQCTKWAITEPSYCHLEGPRQYSVLNKVYLNHWDIHSVSKFDGAVV